MNAPGYYTVAVSSYPQSPYIATVEGSFPATNLYSYDGRLVRSINYSTRLFFHPNNRQIIFSFAGNFLVYDIDENNVTDYNFFSQLFALSSDGNHIGTYKGDSYSTEIQLYNYGDKNPYFRRILNYRYTADYFALSPQGKMLAIIVDSGYVEVYNTHTGATMSRFKPFSNGVDKIRFIPGTSVLIASNNGLFSGTVFCNPINGNLLDSIQEFYDYTFSKNSNNLLGISGEGNLSIWQLDYSKLGNLEDLISDVNMAQVNYDNNILPNPSSEYIELADKSFCTGLISIYSILEIKMLDVENPCDKIYIGNLPCGIYFLSVGDKLFKFVKI